jgi:hypothetical protein
MLGQWGNTLGSYPVAKEIYGGGGKNAFLRVYLKSIGGQMLEKLP